MIERHRRVQDYLSAAINTSELLSQQVTTQSIAILLGRIGQIIDQSLDEIVQQLNNELENIKSNLEGT